MCAVEPLIKLLVVEDSADDLLLMVREIKRSGYTVSYKRVESEEDMRSALASDDWDMIISDYTMPCFSGIAALDVLKSIGLDIPLVIVSGTITDETAVSAMRSGAKDYLMKTNLKRLGPVVEREIRESRERLERRLTEESLKSREEEAARIREESEAATKRFMRDTIHAVTDGKLHLISYEEAENMCESADNVIEVNNCEAIGVVRKAVTNAGNRLHMPEDRIHAFVTAVGEAVVNALKHASGGTVSICCAKEKISVCIRDHGEGIESLILPSATLMSRFSTKRSMGFGYAIMLSTADAVYLATGNNGTYTILEQSVEAPVTNLDLAQLQDVW